MYYLVYSSTAAHALTKEQLASILKSSHHNNTAKGITGMLIYAQGKFMQVLEGERNTIHELYLRIVKNPLHTNAYVLLEGPLEERNFADWSMGFKHLESEELLELTGYENIDHFFNVTTIANMSHPALIFLKLFYKKNSSEHSLYLK
jgi:hypothetical protein